MNCLRCHRALEMLDVDEVQFWRCSNCGRDYREEAGRLVDRWLSPLSLVLYGVIFSRRPQDDAESAAEHFRDHELRLQIIADIRDELAHPKQEVREILGFAHDEVTEADVREYLKTVADRLEGVA